MFTKAMEIHAYLFANFAEKHRVGRKELEGAALRLYAELLVRSGDTNERVSDGAEEAIKVMLANERVRETGVLQDRLVLPINSHSSSSQSRKEKPEPPKQALTRCEVVYHMIKDLGLAGGRTPSSVGVGRLAEFAVSAVTHTAAPVRKYGERIALTLYSIDPGRVRRAVEEAMEGPDGTRNRNVALRHLREEFDRRDGRTAERA